MSGEIDSEKSNEPKNENGHDTLMFGPGQRYCEDCRVAWGDESADLVPCPDCAKLTPRIQ